jgi:hypothetical protein
MHRLIENHRDAIADVCRRYNVRRLEVFGSAARGEDFDEGTSDADFLVEFHRPGNRQPLEEFFGLQAELSQLFHRPVDLVEEGAVRNPFIRDAINRTREVVYAA